MSNTTPSRFLQIHTLTSYPAALLNRDDAGFAKRLPFGGATRTRISSQCLKRHWRTAQGPDALGAVPTADGHQPMTVRSRRTFQVEIYDKLVADGIDQDRATAVTEALMSNVLQSSEAKASRKDNDEGDHLRTGQVLVIGRPEVDYFLKLARQTLDEQKDAKAIKKAIDDALGKKEGKKNLAAMGLNKGLSAGLDAAMFGRMITSDILARCDAAVHVAHAFTVHAEESESDYFSAVDDLQDEGETGSGHINSTELTSGLYYSYVVIDVPLLVSNLTGCRQEDWLDADRDLAQEVVRRFLRLVATVSPGAKLGSTAPYAHAQMMLVEAGDTAPRTLANAFLQPVVQDQDPLGNAYGALANHLDELDSVYGAPEGGRRGLALGPKSKLGGALEETLGSLQEVAQWTAARVA